jgi:hypothetical protein
MYTVMDVKRIKTNDEKVIIEVQLREETLTDDSLVYNVVTEFKTNFQEFANDITGHCVPIAFVDTSAADYNESYKLYKMICSGLSVLEGSDKQ